MYVCGMGACENHLYCFNRGSFHKHPFKLIQITQYKNSQLLKEQLQEKSLHIEIRKQKHEINENIQKLKDAFYA